MAKIKLIVDANFKEASTELKKLGQLTESETKRIEKALKRMKGDQLDSFIQKNKLYP